MKKTNKTKVFLPDFYICHPRAPSGKLPLHWWKEEARGRQSVSSFLAVSCLDDFVHFVEETKGNKVACEREDKLAAKEVSNPLNGKLKWVNFAFYLWIKTVCPVELLLCILARYGSLTWGACTNLPRSWSPHGLNTGEVMEDLKMRQRLLRYLEISIWLTGVWSPGCSLDCEETGLIDAAWEEEKKKQIKELRHRRERWSEITREIGRRLRSGVS